jgi:hypothetical protein
VPRDVAILAANVLIRAGAVVARLARIKQCARSEDNHVIIAGVLIFQTSLKAMKQVEHRICCSADNVCSDSPAWGSNARPVLFKFTLLAADLEAPFFNFCDLYLVKVCDRPFACTSAAAKWCQVVGCKLYLAWPFESVKKFHRVPTDAFCCHYRATEGIVFSD